MPRGDKDLCWFRPAEAKLIQFRYVNWKGSEYVYVVEPEAVSFGLWDETGGHPDMPERLDNIDIVLHGMVVTRDDGSGPDTRPEMKTRRRTFLIRYMHDVKVLERSR